MLYRFKSRATGDLIMLEPQGRQILEILGKPLTGPGILQALDLPAAIQKIEEAIQVEEARQKEALQKTPQAQGAQERPEDLSVEQEQDPVGLRRRAKPFLDMLRRSAAEQHDVVWGL
jgi:hypothetical protein